jgi:hypothetical protein
MQYQGPPFFERVEAHNRSTNLIKNIVTTQYVFSTATILYSASFVKATKTSC